MAVDFELVLKTADETVNNSSVLQNDNHLFFPVAANELWMFQLNVWVSSPSAAPDLKFAFTGPAGATGKYGFHAAMSAGSDASNRTANALAATIVWLWPNTPAPGLMTISGFIRNGANAGNLQFQWAQNTPTAQDTKVLQDSHLILYKLP